MTRLVVLAVLAALAGSAAAQDAGSTQAALDRWMKQARSSDRATRERAADALVAMGDVAVPGLEALVDDATLAEDVRGRAVGTLESIAGVSDPALDALMRILRGQEGALRRQASAALGRLSERALPLLVAELRNPGQREVILKTIGGMGPSAASAAPQVAAFLADPDQDVRERAIRVLGRMGEPGAPAIVRAMEDPRLRLGAIEALGDMGSRARGESDALVRMLDDPSAKVRATAVEALASVLPDADVGVPALADRLRDPDAHVRAAAASALARYGADARPAREALLRALDDDDKDVRKESVLSLREIPDFSLVPHLARAANDVSGGVAAAAVRSLQLMGPPAHARLLAILRDRNSGVVPRAHAAGALGRLAQSPDNPPADALPALAAALGDSSEEVRRAAGLALGQLGSAAVPSLVEALGDERRAVRLVALGALWDCGRDAAPALASVVRLLQDPDRDVRLAALDVVTGLGPAAAPAVPSLVVLLKDDATWFRPWWRSGSTVVRPTDVKLAAAAAHALGAIGPAASAAAEDLARELDDDDPRVRAEAADALRRVAVRRADVLDRLRIASDDDDSEVRRNARRAFTELSRQ